MIQLEQLQDMFANIAAGPKWDMNRPMLWGYFFTDHSHERLSDIVSLLEGQGYRTVEIYMPDLEEGEEEYFFLHVEKEEIHSPESLHARNAHFYALAESLGLRSYDGMDVGPVSQD